jgi:predicted DNA-binding protein
MSSAVQDVKDLIDHLPDDTSMEDIQYHLYVLEKVRRGQADIRNGKHFSSDEARERLGKWLNP